MKECPSFESPFSGGVTYKSADDTNVLKSRSNDSCTPLLDKSGPPPEIVKV
jgi:hypothetical protein